MRERSKISVGSNQIHMFEVQDFLRVRYLILIVDSNKSGVRRIQSSVFPFLNRYFWQSRFEVIQAFWTLVYKWAKSSRRVGVNSKTNIY